MYYIPVILGSIRRNRESLKVATFVMDWLKNGHRTNTDLIDLKELDLPMMEERLRFRDGPPAAAEFSGAIQRADAIVIVTPEYNSGYPGVLKNALDYLREEYRRKPFGIITVSSAGLGGIFCLVSLREVVLHLGAIPIPSILAVSNVQDSLDSAGKPMSPDLVRRAKKFFEELLWFTEALAVQRGKDEQVQQSNNGTGQLRTGV